MRIKSTAAPRRMGNCDVAALQRNVATAKKYRVNGTLALVFEDKRVPGASPPDEVEKRMLATRAKG